MPREKNIQFLPLVNDVFNQVFRDFGFELQEETEWDGHGEYTVTASKGEMFLIFYLGLTPLFYYFNIGIKLSGKLARKATTDMHYQKRSVGVLAIATHINPNYKSHLKASQTKKELIGVMEKGKEDLLQYCHEILSGDISIWGEVVNNLVEQRKKSTFKTPTRD